MKLFLVFFTLISSVFAFAGEGSISGGGGGTVVICQAKNGDYTRIDVLDYILQLEYFLTPTPKRKRQDLLALKSYDQILTKLYAEVSFDSDVYAAKYVPLYGRFFVKHMTFKKNLHLPKADINENIIPTIRNQPYCKRGEKTVVRLAAIQDFAKNAIQVDSEIWNHPAFGEFGKAALIFHEGWYAYYFNQPAAVDENLNPAGPQYIYQNVSDYLLETY